MLSKFIQLKDCQITFKNRIPETDKQYAQQLAGHISKQVVASLVTEHKELTSAQAAALSLICQIVADRLVRLKPESEQFVSLQNWVTPHDFQIIMQRQGNILDLSDCAARCIMELILLIPEIKASQIERVYAGRLISKPYMDFLVQRYKIMRSHIQDMLMGRTWPERYIAQVSENITIFKSTLQLPITQIIRLLKKHGENLEHIDVFFQSVQNIANKYPKLKTADIQYFCLETRDPEKMIPAAYRKAQILSAQFHMPISQAFWYICHYHDPDKIREAYLKRKK